MAPDTARRHLVGDVTDRESVRVASLSVLAATEIYPFGATSQHTAMAAFVHFGIVREQESCRPNRAHGLLKQPPVNVRHALKLQRSDVLHSVINRQGWITNI